MKEVIIKALKKETKQKDITLEVPPDQKMGDFAFPCFLLAKELKQKPDKIAEDLKNKLKIKNTKIKTVGPYLNFFIEKSIITKKTIEQIEIEKQCYGMKKLNKKTVMIEYLSPNTNKSLHLGHLRNGALGISISNLLEAVGYKVIRTSVNNDKGTGVAEAIFGYLKFHKDKKPEIKPDHFVAQCYVDGKKAIKKNPELEKEVKEINKKWEENDKEIKKTWKKMLSWVYKGYKESYKNLGYKFDKEYYESEIYKEGKKIVLHGLKKGIFEKEDGAVIANLEKYKLPNKVLLKSDGTSLYMTQDIYLAALKDKDFKINKSIYVVGSEQNNHFKQLFKILELLNYKFNCYHLSYGHVNLPEGKMKSREGTVVDADDLYYEVKDMAKSEIQRRHKLTKKELDKRSHQIAIAALNFHMLKVDPSKDTIYNPKESLSFEGETGPYVQYAHVRCNSILKNYRKKVIEYDPSLIKEESEIKLIKTLADYPNTIEDAASHYKPSTIAHYLINLAQSFNEFYHSNQVISDDKELTKARIKLVEVTKQVLSNGLNLLAIESPDEM